MTRRLKVHRWAALTLYALLIAAPALAQENAEENDTPKTEIRGRVVHHWQTEEGIRVFLVINGFTIAWDNQRLSARDGVVWFDEEAAKETGEISLGVYAEGNVAISQQDGSILRQRVVYLSIKGRGELEVHNEGELRGSAEDSALFLRAKKKRSEHLEAGAEMPPEAAAERPPAEKKPEEAPPEPVPQEIQVIPQDDVRMVNFTSSVEGNERISIWTGGVYILRGDMELAADNVVIWVEEEKAMEALEGEEKPAEKKADEEKTPEEMPRERERVRQMAAEAYLEGHVAINIGDRTIRASKVFYDFRLDRAIILDGKIKTFDRERNIPLYYYAKTIRQVARGVFEAKKARATTCEFGHPHYDVSASRLTLIDLTQEPKEGEEPRPQHVRFSAKNAVTRVRGVPALWWPFLAGEVEEEVTPLRSLRITNQTNRGTGVESQWFLFRLLGLKRRPEGFKLYLDLDYWSKRGPAIGVQGKYQRERYFGELASYYIHDTGQDRGAEGTEVAPSDVHRGRFLWRHRQYFPEPWQRWELTLEFSYISDRNFLNEFFEEEFKEGKTQETVVYLKHQKDDTAFTFLVKPRINDFLTVTEYFPRLDYKIIGRSLLDDRLTYFTHNEIAGAKYRPGSSVTTPDSPETFIADTKHEVDWPLAVGPAKIVPYGELRGSYFSSVMTSGADNGRAYGAAGLRAATQLWRTFDAIESEFWNVHRLRHVNTFEAYILQGGTNVESRDLWPFDVPEAGTPPVQGVDDTDEVRLLWRQRYQTMRGIPGKRRSVDWISIDTEAKFYSDTTAPYVTPEGDTERNQVDVDARWLLSDQTSVLAGLNVDTDAPSLDTANIGLAVTQSPRFSYYVGTRYVGPADSHRLTFNTDYVINTKWRVQFFQDYDFEQQENASSKISLVRRLHRWIMTVSLDRDAIRDVTGITVQFQPMGAPEIRVGL